MRIALWLGVLAAFPAAAQLPDSMYLQLPQATVKPLPAASLLRLTSSESTLDREAMDQQPTVSVVSAVNSMPGVRMEERSPGSYRLSIRGSLLRSPFGVRNVKIYLGELPFTDAGGNTYLNTVDFSHVNSIRVLKGPEASIFGANTGGVMLIDPVPDPKDSLQITLSAGGGSFGLFQQSASVSKRWKKSMINISQAFQRSDGYRENSSMQRYFVQFYGQWNYSSRTSLKAFILFSDLDYRTPGGLTLAQFNENPRAARPATATLPGAVEQNAGIHNRTIFQGVTHEWQMTSRIRHVAAVFGSLTDFENPFITNFETRRENTFGARTYLDYGTRRTAKFNAHIQAGAEASHTEALIDNYNNMQGTATGLQASDRINTNQAFLFARIAADIYTKLRLEVSVSYNFFGYKYQDNTGVQPDSTGKRNFTPQLMPRVALSYLVLPSLSLRASVSRGYSPPTIAEVRSSDNVVNTALQAEKGLNYEAGIRFTGLKGHLQLDASVFYFTLQDAIVRRLNADGTEYFINAGGTSQLGIEGQADIWLIKKRTEHFIRGLKISGNITYNPFTFTEYETNGMNYSGNRLTGVPLYTSTESLHISFPLGFSFFAQYYYVSDIPLNDAGTAMGNAYQLVQLKGSWQKNIRKTELVLFAGIDNLLNESYSLGNDLNAAGNRYFNAAPPRNYYGGIKVTL